MSTTKFSATNAKKLALNLRAQADDRLEDILAYIEDEATEGKLGCKYDMLGGANLAPFVCDSLTELGFMVTVDYKKDEEDRERTVYNIHWRMATIEEEE